MFKVKYEKPDINELRKEGFVADMHFHTEYSHDCKTPIKDIINLARRLGIYVAITDHNQIGGVLEATKYKNAPIIPGIEICTKEGKDVLVYFKEAEDLKEFYNEQLKVYLKDKNSLRSDRTSISFKFLMQILDKEKCVVVLAHPFAPMPRRSYNYLMRKNRQKLMEHFDGVEVFNHTMTRRSNLSSLGFAAQFAKGVTGGSDGHVLKSLGKGVTVSRSKNVSEHLDSICKGRVLVVGKEMKQRERVIVAKNIVRNKLTNGVTGSLKKGISLPGRVSRSMMKSIREKS